MCFSASCRLHSANNNLLEKQTSLSPSETVSHVTFSCPKLIIKVSWRVETTDDFVIHQLTIILQINYIYILCRPFQYLFPYFIPYETKRSLQMLDFILYSIIKTHRFNKFKMGAPMSTRIQKYTLFCCQIIQYIYSIYRFFRCFQTQVQNRSVWASVRKEQIL